MKLHLSSAAGGENGADVLVLDVPAGLPLSRAIWLSGQLRPLPLCGGLGRCGRCRIRFLGPTPQALPAEEAVFSVAELSAGWRLACRRQVPEGNGVLALALPAEDFENAALHEQTDAPCRTLQTADSDAVLLAVDLGTTSVYWQALAATDGAVLAQGRFLNPQAGAGADIMSRLAVARSVDGRGRLALLVREAMQRTVAQVERQGRHVSKMAVAANTAMTDIFLNRDIEGLCAAPYRSVHKGHEWASVAGLPPVYIPPLPAPFVGGDISAALAALLAEEIPRPFVLADLGTNGELALLTENNELLLTSVPLGPALEGIGPQCGQLAGPDVVTHFSLSPTGLVATSPDGQGGKARGISATGYLSLLALLRQWGILDVTGLFAATPPAMPLARNVAAGLHKEAGHTRLDLPRGLWLAAADVEELIKVKAAFALALEALLNAAGLAPRRLAALCLAGALGEHIKAADLEVLGFIPAGLGARLRAVGNASLHGAGLLLQAPDKAEALARLCARARVLPLVEDVDFHEKYLRHMRLGV